MPLTSEPGKCCVRPEEIALSAHTPCRSNRSHSASPCARSAYDSSSSTCPVPANRRARGYRITSDSPDSRKFRTGSKLTIRQIAEREHLHINMVWKLCHRKPVNLGRNPSLLRPSPHDRFASERYWRERLPVAHKQ